MPDVQSSNIRSVSYDDDARELSVTFRSGITYLYAEVPRAVYDALLSAASVGGYFSDHVRGRYKTTKLEAAHAEQRET